jgi:hypothetical protein
MIIIENLIDNYRSLIKIEIESKDFLTYKFE